MPLHRCSMEVRRSGLWTPEYFYYDDYLIKMYSSWPFYFDVSRKTKQKQTNKNFIMLQL